MWKWRLPKQIKQQMKRGRRIWCQKPSDKNKFQSTLKIQHFEGKFGFRVLRNRKRKRKRHKVREQKSQIPFSAFWRAMIWDFGGILTRILMKCELRSVIISRWPRVGYCCRGLMEMLIGLVLVVLRTSSPQSGMKPSLDGKASPKVSGKRSWARDLNEFRVEEGKSSHYISNYRLDFSYSYLEYLDLRTYSSTMMNLLNVDFEVEFAAIISYDVNNPCLVHKNKAIQTKAPHLPVVIFDSNTPYNYHFKMERLLSEQNTSTNLVVCMINIREQQHIEGKNDVGQQRVSLNKHKHYEKADFVGDVDVAFFCIYAYPCCVDRTIGLTTCFLGLLALSCYSCKPSCTTSWRAYAEILTRHSPKRSRPNCTSNHDRAGKTLEHITENEQLIPKKLRKCISTLKHEQLDVYLQRRTSNAKQT